MKRLLLSVLFLSSIFSSRVFALPEADRAKAYYHYSLATLYELREEHTKAIAEFELAVAQDTESVPLRVDFATSLWKAGQVEKAIEQSELASQMEPDNPAPHYLLGRIYASRGEPAAVEKAVAELRRSVELDPEHSEALYDLGRLLFSQGEYQGTVETLGRLIELVPWVAAAYELAARAHVELDQEAQAISVLEAALEYNDTYPGILRMLADLYQSTGQTEKALAFYGDVIKRVNDGDMLFNYATLLLDRKDFAKGIPMLRDLARSYPKNVRLNLTLARALREYKKYGEAARVLERLLEEDPTHFGLNYELAETLVFVGENRRAEELLLKLRGRSDSGDQRQGLDTNLALLYQEEGRFDEALELFRKLQSANPDDQFTGLRLVYALRDAEKFSEALTLSDQLIGERDGIDPDRPPKLDYLLISKAQVLSSLDRPDEAVQLLRTQLTGSSEAVNLYLAASVIYSDHGRLQEAEAVIREGLDRYPDNERLRFQLGAVFEQKGELESVEAVFDGILEENPNHAGVLNYLGYMFADRGIRLHEALEYIQRAVEIEPHNGAFLDSLGWVYFKLEEVEKAEQNLLEAARINGSDATIYDHLGDLYQRLKQYDRARDYYQKSIQFAEEEELERVGKKLAELEELLSGTDR